MLRPTRMEMESTSATRSRRWSSPLVDPNPSVAARETGRRHRGRPAQLRPLAGGGQDRGVWRDPRHRRKKDLERQTAVDDFSRQRTTAGLLALPAPPPQREDPASQTLGRGWRRGCGVSRSLAPDRDDGYGINGGGGGCWMGEWCCAVGSKGKEG